MTTNDAEAANASPPGNSTQPGSDKTKPDAPATQANVEWAAVLLGVLAGTILPVCYGVLGAAAAVIRGIARRMQENTLMPRHIEFGFTQLALGALIGACIGLFIAPEASGAGAQPGLLGPVHLSASALCFIAGFSVEGVFEALESLSRRVFNQEPPKPVTQ